MIDLVGILYNKALQEYNSHRRNSDTIWVSSLTQCPLKWRYSLRYPELAISSFFSGSFEIGKLIHTGIQTILQETFDGVKVEVELEKVVDGTRVRGRADALLDRTVVEIKYAKSDQSLPHQHHIDQLRIYMNLANRERGVLFYITPDRVAQYEFNDPMSEQELLRLVQHFKAGTPAPRFGWECRYCPFRKICPNAR